MGDVIFHKEVPNNRGVVMGHANSTAANGVNVTGSSATYNGHEPSDFETTAG
jgi:hypothetical protein